MGRPRSEVPAVGLVLFRAASRRTGCDGFPIVRLSSDYCVSGVAGGPVWMWPWQEAQTTRVWGSPLVPHTSLREAMAETLTVLRLGVPPTLARTLHSTNPIESMIEICREHAGNVKRWQDGQMALRWCAAGMVRKQFRRVNCPRPARPTRRLGGPGRWRCPNRMRGSQGNASSLMLIGAATEVPRNSGHPRLPPGCAIVPSRPTRQ